MIVFEKKTIVDKSDAPAAETNRFETIRKAAAERSKRADTDGTRRRDKQTTENNRLL